MKRAKQARVRKVGDGYPVPRVYHRKAHRKKSARLLIKCGDCENKFEIYYGPQGEDLEIAGVLASVENWRRFWHRCLNLSGSHRKPVICCVRLPTRSAC
jgi:hypothetical protein